MPQRTVLFSRAKVPQKWRVSAPGAKSWTIGNPRSSDSIPGSRVAGKPVRPEPGAPPTSSFFAMPEQLRAQRCKPRARRPVPSRPYNQRCAVRVMYAKNATRGQWKAHGRYIARESASQGRAVEAGFDATELGINIAARLDQWQSAGDERMWKLIVSPEFGDKMDLVQLTRDLMQRMTRDLDTQLEWVAVSHFNTDNPHVHIALRGVREDGKSLRLERDYVKHGIRSIAEDLCTRRLGYRTQRDIAEAQRREVSQQRFTSLDRSIARNKPIDGQSSHFQFSRNPAQPRNQYVIERLRTLESMGLAEVAGPDQWRVRQDFETALRAMQRLGDRQKILATHGVPVSDTRLPLVMFDLRNCTTLEGRILAHGEDEGTGRSFMMLEGTDAKVHCIYHTPQMAEARGRGGLRANRFVRLRKLFENGRPLLEIDDLGPSERILSDDFILKKRQETHGQWKSPSGRWLGRLARSLSIGPSEGGGDSNAPSSTFTDSRENRIVVEAVEHRGAPTVLPLEGWYENQNSKGRCDAMTADEILTVAEVASELRCSKAHVITRLRGKLRCVPLPAIFMGRRS